MSNFPIRRASADGCKGWVLYDQFPRQTAILGYFTHLERAEEMAPKLLNLHARELAAKEQVETEEKKAKPIKRKA